VILRIIIDKHLSRIDVSHRLNKAVRTIKAENTYMANYHPFEGNFRLTAGIMNNGNELKSQAKPTTGIYEIGGTIYTAAQVGTLRGTVDFKAMAPYLGPGWGKSPKSGFGASLDLGALFQGSPSVNFTADDLIAGDPTFQANLAQEETNAQNEIDGFTLYPVISLGVNYRF
jgi:hypothetical protein